jgi:hypothetical protein
MIPLLPKLFLFICFLFLLNKQAISSGYLMYPSEDSTIQKKSLFTGEKKMKKPGFFKKLLIRGLYYVSIKGKEEKRENSLGKVSLAAGILGVLLLIITLVGGGLLLAGAGILSLTGLITGLISNKNEGPNKAANAGVIISAATIGAIVILFLLFLLLFSFL